MLKPLDRHRRDSTLFQFTNRHLRDCVDPDHLLIRIDEQFDFGELVDPLEDRYCPDNGRPAIPVSANVKMSEIAVYVQRECPDKCSELSWR